MIEFYVNLAVGTLTTILISLMGVCFLRAHSITSCASQSFMILLLAGMCVSNFHPMSRQQCYYMCLKEVESKI